MEDYVYKLPPPKSKSEVGLDANLITPTNLPKDIVTKLDVIIVSELLHFFFIVFYFTIMFKKIILNT